MKDSFGQYKTVQKESNSIIIENAVMASSLFYIANSILSFVYNFINIFCTYTKVKASRKYVVNYIEAIFFIF